MFPSSGPPPPPPPSRSHPPEAPVAVRARGSNDDLYIDRATLRMIPGRNRILTGEGLAVGPAGVLRVNGIDADVLGLVVDCIGRWGDLENFLTERVIPVEQMAQVLNACEYLGLDGIRNEVFKQIAGTFSKWDSNPQIAVSKDGHASRKGTSAQSLDGWAMGRFACAVGTHMRVRFMIRPTVWPPFEDLAGHYGGPYNPYPHYTIGGPSIMLGFAPIEDFVSIPPPQVGYGHHGLTVGQPIEPVENVAPPHVAAGHGPVVGFAGPPPASDPRNDPRVVSNPGAIEDMFNRGPLNGGWPSTGPNVQVSVSTHPSRFHFSPHKPNGFTWHSGTGKVFHNRHLTNGTDFPDGSTHKFTFGDVLEIEFDNHNGLAQCYKNGVRVGGGAVTALGKGVPMYPVVVFDNSCFFDVSHAAVSMELVTFTMPVGAARSLRGLRGLV